MFATHNLPGSNVDVNDRITGFWVLRTELTRQLTLRGVCVCGIFSLEVIALGGRIVKIPIQFCTVDKSRQIAWYHAKQIFYLLPRLFRKNKTGLAAIVTAGKIGETSRAMPTIMNEIFCHESHEFPLIFRVNS